jgi:hypothetical protein
VTDLALHSYESEGSGSVGGDPVPAMRRNTDSKPLSVTKLLGPAALSAGETARAQKRKDSATRLRHLLKTATEQRKRLCPQPWASISPDLRTNFVLRLAVRKAQSSANRREQPESFRPGATRSGSPK